VLGVFLTLAGVVAIFVAAYAALRMAGELERRRREAIIQQQLAVFAPAIRAVQHDPTQLLAWYPIAQISRRVFPEAFAELDKAAGGTFPFTKSMVEAAHAKCSADWLAWERSHDAEFSVKAAEVHHEIERTGQSAEQAPPLLRARLAAIEQQKLERYQQRYEEYVKTAKALAAFVE
jgi:hypothetical protein